MVFNVSLRFGGFFHITLLWLELQLIFPSQVSSALTAIVEWSLYVLVLTLSPFLIFSLLCAAEEGSDWVTLVATWWWAGVNPSQLARALWIPSPWVVPDFTEQISPQLDPVSLPASRGWTRWPLDITSNQIYFTSKALWVGLRELEEQEEKHNGGNRFLFSELINNLPNKQKKLDNIANWVSSN